MALWAPVAIISTKPFVTKKYTFVFLLTDKFFSRTLGLVGRRLMGKFGIFFVLFYVSIQLTGCQAFAFCHLPLASHTRGVSAFRDAIGD